MPEFKNREEYEAWKAERLKQGIKATKIVQPNHKQFKKWKFVLYITVPAIVMFVGLYIYQLYKEKHEYQAYKREASATLLELEKLSAAAEVGISLVDYTKKLGEINYHVTAFLDKYKNYKIDSRPISYQVIKNSMEIYLNLKKKWEISIKSNDSYLLSITKDHIGKGWAAIGYDIKLSRQILEEGNKDRWKKLTAELISAQELWNNEDIDYHNKLDAYKTELQKTEDKIKSSLENLKRDVQKIGR